MESNLRLEHGVLSHPCFQLTRHVSRDFRHVVLTRWPVSATQMMTSIDKLADLLAALSPTHQDHGEKHTLRPWGKSYTKTHDENVEGPYKWSLANDKCDRPRNEELSLDGMHPNML